jgi:Zn-dependent M28 family amino/carboxypeptidase
VKSVLLLFIPTLIWFYSAGHRKEGDRNIIVKPAELREWVSYLASDAMKGRADGSPEMKTAALWIAGMYNKTGLKPVEKAGGYIQDYSYTAGQKTIDERNVIGTIEGTDPELKNEYLVLSAHFDHIGIRKGSEKDSIYNGADDNAAGTCMLIGIAKTIIASGMKPGRTIVFGAFSGEEDGMKGSKFYVANRLFPLNKTYADLNFEMTGHSEFLGKNRYYMTGCAYSDLDSLIGEYNKQSEWKLVDTVSLSNMLFYSSDNIAFSRINSVDGKFQGIPSGTFATSAIAVHLHQVFDEAELFDFDNMAGLVSYFSDLIIWLSNNKSEIQWTDPRFTRLK